MRWITTTAGALLVTAASLFFLTIKSPSPAYGQALQQLRDAQSMSFTELLTISGQKEPVKTNEIIAADGRRRSEMPLAGITTIFDANGHARLTLMNLGKRALVTAPVKLDQPVVEKLGFIAWLEALKKLGDKPEKELGQKEMNGRRVTGFVASQANMTVTIWIDDTTRELAQIEYDSPIAGTGYQHVTMTDFRFGEKVDESLFSLSVPEGYQEQQQPVIPAVPGGEPSIIDALRGYTKRDGGKFPVSITDWGPWCVLFSKDSHDGKLDDETLKVLAHLGSITAFLSSMPKDTYQYLGEGKTIDQKESMVFWYKKPDGTYRAIYGDFSAKDVTLEDLPKK